MLGEQYQPPRVRTITIAGILFLALLIAFWLLSDVVKILGAPFLFLPAKLGLVQQVAKDQVLTIESASGPVPLIVGKPGRYAVFTGDYKLLATTNKLLDGQEKPWLIVRSPVTGERVAVSFVERGLRPYDTPLARGRPIFSFEIQAPGRYEVANPPRDATIAVLPDYTTGREGVIALAYALQLGALALGIGLIYHWRRRGFRAWRKRIHIATQRKKVRADAFWQAEIRRSKESRDKQIK